MGEFPLVCGFRGFLLLICSSVIYGGMNGEGLEGLIALESATFQYEIGFGDLFSFGSRSVTCSCRILCALE